MCVDCRFIRFLNFCHEIIFSSVQAISLTIKMLARCIAQTGTDTGLWDSGCSYYLLTAPTFQMSMSLLWSQEKVLQSLFVLKSIVSIVTEWTPSQTVPQPLLLPDSSHPCYSTLPPPALHNTPYHFRTLWHPQNIFSSFVLSLCSL